MTGEERPIELAKDGGAHRWAGFDADLAAGRIDEAGWFAAANAVIERAYLDPANDGNPRAQSGKSGDAAAWEAARRPLMAAIDAPGDFLDIGCASGLLMESVHAWAAADGLAVEPYGLDLSPRLADLARRRLPHWAGRIWTGNALYWQPGRTFDYVRVGLEYVPAAHADALVDRLLSYTSKRLIIGMRNEDKGWRETEAALLRPVDGRIDVPHDDRRLVRRAVWINA